MSRAGWSFGVALNALKSGQRVQREGWNGKGMFLVLVTPGDSLPFGDQRPAYLTRSAPGFPLPWIGMKTADDGFVPWLASQTDMLAEDWWVLP